MHAYIVLANPLGGIGEWNAINVFLEWYLFSAHEIDLSSLGAIPTPLAAYLFVSLYVAPVLGNVRPDAMSYLLAIRNYSGNHATSLLVARASALPKLNKVRTATASHHHAPHAPHAPRSPCPPSVRVSLAGVFRCRAPMPCSPTWPLRATR